MNKTLAAQFFNRDASLIAKELLGKVLRHYYQGIWLSALIIETEAYYLHEKGSHASLGFTEKRKALFMPPGTVYMYYARGGDSCNISCQGEGNAVLLKSGIPYLAEANENMLATMQLLNPLPNGGVRPINKLCAGQTLLCKSLGLKVPHWNQKPLDPQSLRVDDVGYQPMKIIQTTRLGIPKGRDEHLSLRFIDYQYATYSTSNPLTKRNWQEGKQYQLLDYADAIHV
ncbi:MAG: DNA-3-methyladenine glycosylase [Gammaproteobacteria bacterium]